MEDEEDKCLVALGKVEACKTPFSRKKLTECRAWHYFAEGEERTIKRARKRAKTEGKEFCEVGGNNGIFQ